MNVYSKVEKEWVRQESGWKKFTHGEDLNSKLNRLGFDAELALKIICFPLSIKGTANYLKKEKKYFNSKDINVEYILVTGSESITNKSKIDI